MKINAIILGSLFVYCALGFSASSECLPYADPNDYIDNPDTLENGFFECGDPNNLTSYGTDYGFMPPIYWERLPEPSNKNQDCYAEILSSFIPEFLDPDDDDYWEIPAPFEGNSFVLLSTEFTPNANRTLSVRNLLQTGDLIRIHSGQRRVCGPLPTPISAIQTRRIQIFPTHTSPGIIQTCWTPK